jgi:hypothetical protein
MDIKEFSDKAMEYKIKGCNAKGQCATVIKSRHMWWVWICIRKSSPQKFARQTCYCLRVCQGACIREPSETSAPTWRADARLLCASCF